MAEVSTTVSDLKTLKPEHRREAGRILMSSASGRRYVATVRGVSLRLLDESEALVAVIPWQGFSVRGDFETASFDDIAAWAAREIATEELTTLNVSPKSFIALIQAFADLVGGIIEVTPYHAQSGEPQDASDLVLDRIHSVASPLFYQLDQDGQGVFYRRTREIAVQATRDLTDHDRLAAADLLMTIVEHLPAEDRPAFEQAVNEISAARP